MAIPLGKFLYYRKQSRLIKGSLDSQKFFKCLSDALLLCLNWNLILSTRLLWIFNLRGSSVENKMNMITLHGGQNLKPFFIARKITPLKNLCFYWLLACRYFFNCLVCFLESYRLPGRLKLLVFGTETNCGC